MKFLFTIYSLFFIASTCLSQVEFDKVKHDFGNLQSYSERFVDIVLTNKGTKQEWLLSVKKPTDVVYIQSKQFIEKDSSIIVRLQVNPKEKGRFHYDVSVFTSDRSEAVIVKLNGNLLEVPQDNSGEFAACPNFNERPGGKNPNDFKLTVVTIDKETKMELSNSTVSLIQNGTSVWTKRTDKKGRIVEEATLGLSYFYATQESYLPEEMGAYINFQRNYIVLELSKDPSYCPPVPVPVIVDTMIVAVVPEPEVVIEIDEQLLNEETTAIETELPPAFTDLSTDNFDEEYFEPINVVFVLDVSSSMAQVDKIELMKYSLSQLVDMLRPQDKVGLVTYASDARVLLKPTTGADKETLKAEVAKLEAFGYTSGGMGIKLGFKEALKGKIDGINHVIVVTDGAFNQNSEDYKKYVKKYAKKGIHMSVVGIKNKDVHEAEMKEAAALGQGHYIPIMKLSDAQMNLKQAIRILAYKF